MSVFDKVSSFDQLLKEAVSTFARFPLTLVSATLGVIVSIDLIENPGIDISHLRPKLLMVTAMGLPLFTSLVFFGESRKWNNLKIQLLQAVGAFALVGYFFSLPEMLTTEPWQVFRYGLLIIGLHFLVSFLPYMGTNQTRGFWQYNKSLFLRFLTAALYSAVMYTGLAIALASADHLFGMNIDSKLYFKLWIVISGVFHTWLFLAGLPNNLDELNSVDDYPTGLKVFTQYILLPLVALYLFILYAYEAKIIVTWNWPIGWVSNLVLWYSVVGIFSLLLLHPLKDRAENKWIAKFSKWFFRALIPLVALLFLAILRRISDYGITENRYIVMAMAIGLSIVVLYFIFSKVRDIRIIPIVICCIAFLSAFGPWGAFSVSLKSQQNRLESMLIENNLLSDGVIQKSSENIPIENRREMSSIISYLTKWHGAESLSDWIDDSTINEIDSLSYYSKSEKISAAFGFNLVGGLGNSSSSEYFNFNTPKNKPLEVSGYDYVLELHSYDIISLKKEEDRTFYFDDKKIKIELDDEMSSMSIQFGDSNLTNNLVEFALSERIAALRDSSLSGELPINSLMFTESSSDFDAKIILSWLAGHETTDGIVITALTAQLLIRIH